MTGVARSLWLGLSLALLGGELPAQARPSVAQPASRLGFAPDRLARIDRFLQQAVVPPGRRRFGMARQESTAPAKGVSR